MVAFKDGMVAIQRGFISAFKGMGEGEYPVLIRSPLYIGQESSLADLAPALTGVLCGPSSEAELSNGTEDTSSSEMIARERRLTLDGNDMILSPGLTYRANKIGFI